MNPTPTGRVVSTSDGRDLELTRTFRAPIDDVWASLTESARTAAWIGPWTGESGVGRTVTLRLIAEEGGLTLSIADDGDTGEEMPGKPGFGASVVSSLVDQLEGVLERTGGPQGTSVTVVIRRKG